MVRRLSRVTLAHLLIGLAVCVGLALRIEAARGDLWLDELWSLDLVSRLTSPDQVFWNISHDNSHFLNSLWMYGVGQHRSPIVYRLPSVLFSTVAILAAARIAARVNAAAAVAAAWMTSCSYVVIDYGSEARGYSGLILATIVATGLAHRILDRLDQDPAVASSALDRWAMALVIFAGACAHLTMVAEAAVLGAATTLHLMMRGVGLKASLARAVDVFRPSLLLLLPILAGVLAGILVKGEFTIGGYEPFTAQKFVTGYGGLMAELLGLRPLTTPLLALVLAVALVAAGLAARLLDRRWTSLAVTGLLLWPGAVFALRIGNTEFPRYFLVAGLLVPIFLAEVAGRLWDRGRLYRGCAVALVAGICLGQGEDVRTLLSVHRGSPAAAVAFMGEDGPTAYIARMPAATDPAVAFYAARVGIVLQATDRSDLCSDPPAWIVYDSDFGEAVPGTLSIGPPPCRHSYGQRRAFPAALWSGRAWTVFHRDP